MTMNFSDIFGYVVFDFEMVHIFKSLKVAYRRMAIANNEGGEREADGGIRPQVLLPLAD